MLKGAIRRLYVALKSVEKVVASASAKVRPSWPWVTAAETNFSIVRFKNPKHRSRVKVYQLVLGKGVKKCFSIGRRIQTDQF